MTQLSFCIYKERKFNEQKIKLRIEKINWNTILCYQNDMTNVTHEIFYYTHLHLLQKLVCENRSKKKNFVFYYQSYGQTHNDLIATAYFVENVHFSLFRNYST